jgi:putative ABC transport system substrate-binding protein
MHFDQMRRREFITLLGGAAAWPLAARAQHPMPVIGFLDNRSSDGMASRLAAFHKGLKEVGLVEGENVTIVYRWAEDRLDRLPEMASELARQATVIVTTGGPPAAFAAKATTTTVPIVFLVGEDPTRLGLVPSLARPSGNLTGINMLANELEAKRLQLLHQLVPQAQRVAVLVNPNSVINAETTLRDVEPAARTIGLQLQVLKASTAREIEAAFAWSEGQRPDAPFRCSHCLLEHPACATGAIGGLPSPGRHLWAA